MIAFIDDHRGGHGVEPICRVLPIAPSTYRAHVARRIDPARLPPRAKRDLVLTHEIRRVFDANFRVYGVRKVWRQLGREGIDAARCTVARLMRQMGLQGAVRGREVRTTISNPAAACPQDRVNRQFRALRPNALWLSHFTYVATWQGVVYVAFVIDAYARRIVGWRVSRTAHTGFVLDALEQALADRRPVQGGGLVHHSHRECNLGSTIAASSSRSETCLPLKPKRDTMLNLRHFRWRRDSGKLASDKPGAVHSARRARDSQSVKTTESGGIRGYDAGKKIKGRKRHAMVDTDGRALKLQAYSAAIQDRDGAGPLLQASRPRWPFVALGYADGGYAGPQVANASSIHIEVVRKSDNQVGFAVIARRWVVERFFASTPPPVCS